MDDQILFHFTISSLGWIMLITAAVIGPIVRLLKTWSKRSYPEIFCSLSKGKRPNCTPLHPFSSMRAPTRQVCLVGPLWTPERISGCIHLLLERMRAREREICRKKIIKIVHYVQVRRLKKSNIRDEKPKIQVPNLFWTWKQREHRDTFEVSNV